MRVAIVANSVFQRDCGREIDRSDIVIRFNRCECFAANSGRKTTVLAFCNTGKSGLFFTQRHILNAIPGFADVKTVWLPRNPAVYAVKKAVLPFFNHSKRVGMTDHSAEIIHQMGGREVVIFDAAIHLALETKLRHLGAGPDILPSTGLLAIEYVLERIAAKRDEILLFGFSHQGIRAHDWNCEHSLIDQYVKQGLLCRADDALEGEWKRPKAKHWNSLVRLRELHPANLRHQPLSA